MSGLTVGLRLKGIQYGDGIILGIEVILIDGVAVTGFVVGLALIGSSEEDCDGLIGFVAVGKNVDGLQVWLGLESIVDGIEDGFIDGIEIGIEFVVMDGSFAAIPERARLLVSDGFIMSDVGLNVK